MCYTPEKGRSQLRLGDLCLGPSVASQCPEDKTRLACPALHGLAAVKTPASLCSALPLTVCLLITWTLV